MENIKKYKIHLFFLISFIIVVPAINKYLNALERSFGKEFGIGTAIIIWIFLNAIIIFAIKNIITTKENSKIETEGVNLKKNDGTYGTADWGTREEIQEYLSIGKRDGIILGETEEQEIITLPLNTYLNKNIAVFGSSGSGKSAGFAIPNGMELAQEELQKSVNRNMSMVFTDPKRRTVQETIQISYKKRI